MKRNLVLFLLLFFSSLGFGGENEEFRATWVITWEHINSGSSVEQNKARVRKILDNHKKANMNAVLWQCRQGGTAYYSSSYEPWGRLAGREYPGYDPLAYAIEEAHKRGLELHAWFNVFQTSSTDPGTPAAEHPEWICRDRDGNPMTASRSVSPGLAEVREYTINVAMEIVRKYDIDGLHLDYVRWNEYTNTPQSLSLAKKAEKQQFFDGMITEEQIQELTANSSGRYLYDYQHPYSAGVPQGFASWEDWWRWSVTEFVRVLHDSIQAVKPWVRLSPAVLGKYNWSSWQAYGTVYQDAALWFNEGYIEQLTPMHYHWITANDFYNMLVSPSGQSWGPWITKGIAEKRLYTVGPGSYVLDNYNVWNRHPQIVNKCRTVEWVDGFQFFSYGSWENYKYWDEAGRTFFSRKTKIRPIITTVVPEAPSINLTKIDSLNYRITVIPPDNLTGEQWFALYRSTDEVYNPSEDEIINIYFGKNQVWVYERFTGNQDFNGQYRYFATMLNRYWNESDISNIETSDLIPSFPPTVVSTIPGEGATIAVNRAVEITFSKTMDIATVEQAISFSPDVEIAQLVWSNDNHTVTIEMKNYFSYNTAYTLTISAQAKDINGRALDGNGDKIPGDPFVLHFNSSAYDNVPPQVFYSHPQPDSSNEQFDILDVVSFAFDEILDDNSLSDDNISLYKGSFKVPSKFSHFVLNDRSILTLQAENPLETKTEYSALLWDTIRDTSGNSLESYYLVNFKTAIENYQQIRLMDDFTAPGGWWQPGGSGSTTGIIGYNTQWGYTAANYLPATQPRKSAFLQYEWDTSDSTFLIREYLPSTDSKNMIFDTTYTFQCYVFGDGSRNKLRFCVDDSTKDQGAFHEVSKWITIDWYGWRLIEWRLNDPNSVGQWLGDGVLNGPSLRFDSIQLTHESGAAVSGIIYFDNIRLVKKSASITDTKKTEPRTPSSFTLYQNYPNPFNPTTKIPFDVATRGHVTLKVYNMLGHEVATLIDEPVEAGHYEFIFNGANLASGYYIYRLEFNGAVLRKRMVLIK